MKFEDEVKPIVADVMRLVQGAMRRQLELQGHRLTGKTSESIQFEVDAETGYVVGRMYANDIAGILEFGVKASRIPYGGGGGGGKSLYIQGLISFWQQRGLSGREAIGAAFATAAVHKREGMPSRGSYRFSRTGARTGFVRAAINDEMQEIASIIEERFGARLLIEFGEFFAEYPYIKLIG